MECTFSKETQFIKTDDWRGYDEPIYAVVGWNDTGVSVGSPCPTYTGVAESKLAREILTQNKIKYRSMTCKSSNVFCVHHYLIVPVEQIKRARRIIKEWYEGIEPLTKLLYTVEAEDVTPEEEENS